MSWPKGLLNCKLSRAKKIITENNNRKSSSNYNNNYLYGNYNCYKE